MNRTPTYVVIAIALICANVARGQEDVAPVVSTIADAPASALSPDQMSIEPLSKSDRDHWAFHSVRRPSIPKVRASGWLRTEVDAFVLSRLEQKKIVPASEADRATLLRRLTFDLTGLPPTVNEWQAFEADQSDDAYDHAVDRLLASPEYGTKWGQHWLDLARFAETDGFEHDHVRKDVWMYRDWVIAAFNQDLPYDRFVQQQIAGDLAGKHGVATMFCLSGPDMPDLNDQAERRHLLLNEMTSTVGSVFLGLQMGCAECHDHKTDPVTQADFYRLRAVFESAIPSLKRDAHYSQLSEQPRFATPRLWIRGDHRRAGPIVEVAFPRIASRHDDGDLPQRGSSPRAAFVEWLFRQDNPLTSRIIVNRIWKYHFGRGLFVTPSDVGLQNPEPSHPELLDWLASELRRHGWSLKWLHRQIVCSATYRQASRRMPDDGNWESRLQSDPQNRWYSRRSRQRLDGESLRDAMLSVSGLLSDERGGPGIMAPLPDELVGTLLKGQWTVSPRAADHDRRSIFLFTRRNLRYPLFEAFDRPDANASCAARNRSTTAPQSLLLLNSQFSLRVAQALAGRILCESKDTSQQVRQLFLTTFLRPPSSTEYHQITRFLTDQKNQLVQSKRPPEQLALPTGIEQFEDPYTAASLVDACLAVLNANEFLYLD